MDILTLMCYFANQISMPQKCFQTLLGQFVSHLI